MENSVAIADLLEHAGWIRALARRLTNDDAAADDLVQEAWLAALKRPPRIEERARPWLAEVLRNARRMAFRSETRRSQREQAAIETTPPATADRVVEEVELGRALAEEVLALAEPYREALLLHYYRGLSSVEIGAQLAVSDSTVRGRIKEGLERLRKRLDRKHGHRAAWVRALAPLGGAPMFPRAASSSSVAKGALMNKVVVAGLATLGALAAVYSHHTKSVAASPSAAAAVVPIARAEVATPTVTTSAKTAAPGTDRIASKQAHDAFLQRIVDAQRRAREASGTPTGELDADYITASLQQLTPRFTWCYEQSLLKQPTLRGSLVVHFTITADPEVGGIVSTSEVDTAKSTIADSTMHSCVEQVIYDARFSPPGDDGDVEVEMPFVFEPSGPKDDGAP
jgi:RNA polymerase sigma factor (sigma-70 family)